MYLAVDIGGTKTLIASFKKNGVLDSTLKFETPALYEEFLTKLAENVAKLATNKFMSAAVAIPGKVDREHGVGIAFGNLAWQNVSIGNALSGLINAPVFVENDANLAGLSEARLQPGYRRVLYVTISTGIGGVVVTDGHIDTSTQDAEIGHILLEHEGKLMRWQDFASGKAIFKHFGKRASDISPDDSGAWYMVARNIAIGLIDIIATLTPDCVIIGGGVGTHYEKYKDRLLEELKVYENNLITVPPIFAAKRPEEAVIYGCYHLASDHEKTT